MAHFGRLVLILLVSLSGCALPGRQSDHRIQLWLLDWQPAAERDTTFASRDCPSLRVAAPRSEPGFGTSRMVYSRDPTRLESFSRHAWVDSPARMMTSPLVLALEQTGRFEAVLGPDSGAYARLLLEVDALRLEQRITGAASEIRLGLRLTLTDLSDRKVLGTRELLVVEPAEGVSPEAGVKAANVALARLLKRLESCIDDLLPVGQSPCTQPP